jgi:hypothetical protein
MEGSTGKTNSRPEKKFNTHCLNVTTGVATTEQLEEALHSALAEYCSSNECRIECSFSVSMVTKSTGESYGYAYVWVTNPEVYKLLCNLNEDCSAREQYVTDTSWTLPEDDEEVSSEEHEAEDFGPLPWDTPKDSPKETCSASIQWNHFQASQSEDITNELSSDSSGSLKSSSSWADMAEVDWERQRRREERQARREPRKIKIVHEPLMKLPSFMYTDEQREKVADMMQARDANRPSYEPSPMPQHGYFEVKRASAAEPKQGFHDNVLFSFNLPEGITTADIKVAFSAFCSDVTTQHKRKVEGRIVEEAYPFVAITKRRECFVTYDADTYDAQFAHRMVRRIYLVKKVDGGDQHFTAVFDFAKVTGRAEYRKSEPGDHRRHSSDSSPDGESRSHSVHGLRSTKSESGSQLLAGNDAKPGRKSPNSGPSVKASIQRAPHPNGSGFEPVSRKRLSKSTDTSNTARPPRTQQKRQGSRVISREYGK